MSPSESIPRDPRAFLSALFDAAVSAVHPDQLMDIDLPPRPAGRTIVIGAGKAAASMARALERRWSGPLEGLVVTRYGHGCMLDRLEVVEAAHPVPDSRGLDATRRIVTLAKGAGADDLVIVLVSGGASALLAAPVPGVTLEQKQEVNRALLRSGAPITEMNIVRRRLSAIKGGKLARMIEPARSFTLVISDVAGDDPSVVGSGPTVTDPAPPGEALRILEKYSIDVPPEVHRVVARDERADSNRPLDPGKHVVRVIGTASRMLEAAADFSRSHGVTPLVLADDFEIDAEALASVHASIYRQLLRDRWLPAPCLLLSGGESGVTVRGNGRGGRNSQFLLALALKLDEDPHCWALACDSDGIDGTEDNAGGIVAPDSLLRARRLGLDPSALLADNDAYRFLDSLGDLVVSGPTLTNVNDLRALLITG